MVHPAESTQALTHLSRLNCSLNDRRPVSNDDEVVVLLTPDHQGLPDVERINTALAGDDDTPVSSHL